MPPIAKDRIERAARMYASNQDAGSALGIAPGSFSRLCRRYGIETPQARKHRQRSEWKQDLATSSRNHLSRLDGSTARQNSPKSERSRNVEH